MVGMKNPESKVKHTSKWTNFQIKKKEKPFKIKWFGNKQDWYAKVTETPLTQFIVGNAILGKSAFKNISITNKVAYQIFLNWEWQEIYLKIKILGKNIFNIWIIPKFVSTVISFQKNTAPAEIFAYRNHFLCHFHYFCLIKLDQSCRTVYRTI